MEQQERVTPEEEPLTEGQKDSAGESAEALQEQVELYKDAAARAQAELVNYKARAEREYARLRALGASRAVLTLLPVLDTLEMALLQTGDVREGVRMTRDQFVAALGQLNVEEIDPLGADFSPLDQEALGMTAVAERSQDGKVVEVVRKGYRMSGTVIRPARVHVGQYKPAAEESNQD